MFNLKLYKNIRYITSQKQSKEEKEFLLAEKNFLSDVTNNDDLADYYSFDMKRMKAMPPEIKERIKNNKNIIVEIFKYKPPSFEHFCPTEFKNDPEILTDLKPHWIHYFKEFPYLFNEYSPAVIRNDPEVITAIKPHLLQYFIENPIDFTTYCPPELENDPEMLASLEPWFLDWMERLASAAYPSPMSRTEKFLPKEFKYDKKFASIVLANDEPYFINTYLGTLNNPAKKTQLLKELKPDIIKALNSTQDAHSPDTDLYRILNNFPEDFLKEPEITKFIKKIIVNYYQQGKYKHQKTLSTTVLPESLPDCIKNDFLVDLILKKIKEFHGC